MDKYLKILITLLLITIMSWVYADIRTKTLAANEYEIIPVKETGAFYILNKRTGEIQVMYGLKITGKVESAKDMD